MTKKDFILIAGILKLAKPNHEFFHTQEIATDAWNRTVSMMADALATTNPLFDYARFLTACGVQS